MSVSVYDKTTGQLTPIAGVPAIKLAALTRDLAAYEKMNVASRNFSIGEYVIRSDDNLYKVITPISANDEWRIGTNIELTSLGDELFKNTSNILNNNSTSLESNNIATRFYSVGDYLYYTINNTIYYAKVIAPIVVNDIFENGVNVQNTTISSELIFLNQAIGSTKRSPDFSVTATGETGSSTYGDLLQNIITFLKTYDITNYSWLPHKCYIVEARVNNDNDFIIYQLNENTGDRINFSFVSAYSGGGAYLTTRTISLGLTEGDIYNASNATSSTKITTRNIGAGNRLEFYFY